MTFNPLVPLSTDSPGIFPAQNQANMNVLYANLARDHQFNNTPNSLPPTDNTGYHNLIHMQPQAPTGALANIGRLYVKSSAGQINLFYMDDSGVEFQMTPTAPIRAFVNFNGRSLGTPPFADIRSQYNVTSVERLSTGQFKINFTSPMPNNNYIVAFGGMSNTSSENIVGTVTAGATASSSMNVNYLLVTFRRIESDSAKDPLMGSVTIMSVT